MYSTICIIVFSLVMYIIVVRGMIPLLYSDTKTRTKPLNTIKLIIYTLIVILLGSLTLSIILNNVFDFLIALYGGIK